MDNSLPNINENTPVWRCVDWSTEKANERFLKGKNRYDPYIYDFAVATNGVYMPGEQLKMAEITKKYLEDGITSIYEASFIYDDIFVRVDLMNKTSKGWDIYEVKSSTRIRSYHEYDVSIQWYVLKNLNLIELNDAFIVTLNNEFSKKNDSFKITSGAITDQLLSNNEIKILADLPPREELLSKLVSTMAAPISKFVSTLNAVPMKLLLTLTAIEKK